MNKKILVVDDEPLILKTIDRALSKVGYTVRVAEDADSFITALRRESADLLIMDVNLGGVNSESLLGIIEEMAPGIKILFMSGMPPEVATGYFIEKPFRLDNLRQLISDILDNVAEPLQPNKDDN